MKEETYRVPSNWNNWLRHQSQTRHQSLETPVWPFLATLSSKKLFLKIICLVSVMASCYEEAKSFKSQVAHGAGAYLRFL